MSFSTCCLKTFKWNGTPTGQIGTLANNQTYIASPTTKNPNPNSKPKSTTAILIVHDLLGWTFPNAHLLADHYASEANATVYIPDFFGDEVLPFEPLLAGRFHEVDLPAFRERNARQIREPEIFKCARALRERYDVVVAVGFCYGGWAVFRLGAQLYINQDGIEGRSRQLVDAITAAHPSLLTKEDIDGVTVPVQILAPELDPIFTLELKGYSV